MNELTRRGALATIGLGAVAAAGALATPAQAATVPAARGNSHNNTLTVYLARHGRTWLNTVDRVQGWSDSPLTADGMDIAGRVGKNLAAEIGTIHAAYCADMVRHFQTAQLMLKGARSRLEPRRDQRLREVAFGAFEGAKNEEMWNDAVLPKVGFASIPDALAAGYTMTELVDVIPTVNPDPSLLAETSAVVAARMRAALNAIAASVPPRANANALVVSSGLSITCLLAALGTPVNVPIANGAIAVLTVRKGVWTVLRYNDTHYAA